MPHLDRFTAPQSLTFGVSHFSGMARITLILMVVVLATGCIIPHADVYHPVYGKVNTTLIDSLSGEPIKDAKVILILGRKNDYIPDSSGAPKRPKVAIEKFEHLAKLAYWEGGVWVFPVAFGTLYNGADIFIYKTGYEPVRFKLLWPKDPKLPSYYPETLQLTLCDPSKGKELAIKQATETILEDEWKEYVRRVLERKL